MCLFVFTQREAEQFHKLWGRRVYVNTENNAASQSSSCNMKILTYFSLDMISSVMERGNRNLAFDLASSVSVEQCRFMSSGFRLHRSAGLTPANNLELTSANEAR